MSLFGCTYEIRFLARKLPVPEHDMTKDEAEELKRLEEAFTDCAHRLGVHVSLKMKFPRSVATPPAPAETKGEPK